MVQSKTAKTFNLRKLPKIVWDEFVYSGNLIALGDVLALYSLSVILDIKIKLSFLTVVYFSILVINFFNRYREANYDILTNFERSISIGKYFKYIPYIIGVLFISLVIVTWLYAPINAFVFMLFLLSLGILYTLVFKKITKRILGFKNIMTALPYSLLVIFLPLFQDVHIVFATYLIMIFYFLRIFINTTYCDIKDIDSDRKEGLRTFSVVLGENGTIKMLSVINILSIIPILLGIYLRILPLFSIGILCTLIYAFNYLKSNNTFNKSMFFNVIVDSEFIFWPIYIIIFKYIQG